MSDMVPEPNLGKLLRTFRPKTSNIVAGYIIAVLMIVGGGWLIYFSLIEAAIIKGANGTEIRADWGKASITGILGILLCVGSPFLIWWLSKLKKLVIHYHEYGLGVEGGQAMKFTWADVVKVKETRMSQKMPIVKGAAKHFAPTMHAKNYIVHLKNGQELFFGPNEVDDPESLGFKIKEKTAHLKIPWEVEEDYR